MKAIKLAWLELRRFRGPVRRYVPILLILVPLLYGALYLWSNWDPYGRLDQVPVAVVNSDHPVESNGERIDAGNQFVRQLKEAPLFDWHFVSGDEARDGLQQGRYYFTIQVPSNFSAKLATASEPDPQRATLLTTKNDANGYIAGIMADTVESKLQNQINAAAHASYARSLYGQLGDARHKLDLASQASQQLISGTQLSQQGTAALTTGLGGVRDGTAQVSRGTEQISDATAEVDRRLSAITDFASAQLPQTVNSLVSASQLAVSNLSTIKTGTAFVADRGEENATKLQRLGETHPDLAGDSTYRDSLDSARKLAGATRGRRCPRRRPPTSGRSPCRTTWAPCRTECSRSPLRSTRSAPARPSSPAARTASPTGSTACSRAAERCRAARGSSTTARSGSTRSSTAASTRSRRRTPPRSRAPRTCSATPRRSRRRT